MEPFRIHTGLVAPMDRENVDTDAIIPKQFLKSIKKTGFGAEPVRRMALPRSRRAGGQDPKSRRPNPDFVLNQPRYQGASILLARKNFGCGSSREHAPWALQQYGFRALIAPSYRRHLLQQLLQERPVADRAAASIASTALFDEVAAFPGYRLTIDLDAPGRHDAVGRRDRASRSSRFASTACSAASTTSR